MYVAKYLLYTYSSIIILLIMFIFALTVRCYKHKINLQQITLYRPPDNNRIINIVYGEKNYYLYDVLKSIGVTLDDKQKKLLEQQISEDKHIGFRGE